MRLANMTSLHLGALVGSLLCLGTAGGLEAAVISTDPTVNGYFTAFNSVPSHVSNPPLGIFAPSSPDLLVHKNTTTVCVLGDRFGCFHFATNYQVTRSLLEFALPGDLAGASIPSATLHLNALQTNGSVRQIGLIGYEGDGVLSVADLSSSSLLTTFTPPVTTFPNVSSLAFDVTEFIQDLADSSGDFAGFLMKLTDESPASANTSMSFYHNDPFVDAALWPTLTIAYELEQTSAVPEPGTLALVAGALAGVGLLSRRRRRA